MTTGINLCRCIGGVETLFVAGFKLSASERGLQARTLSSASQLLQPVSRDDHQQESMAKCQLTNVLQRIVDNLQSNNSLSLIFLS